MNTKELSNPEEWVDKYGDALFRIALRRVSDPELAQDLVQETFLAALQAHDRYAGRSAEKSWLVGILNHKVIDHFRRKSREPQRDDTDWSDLAREADKAFDETSHWKLNGSEPSDWPGDPSRLVEQKEFWKLLNQALGELPPRMAKAFVLREVEELSADQVCEILNVTPGNLWVLLHRARKQLRQRLEHHLATSVSEGFNPNHLVAGASAA